jgi:hypothetical protein
MSDSGFILLEDVVMCKLREGIFAKLGFIWAMPFS